MQTMLEADVCWQAMLDRNPQYDGEFVVAVKTTRIYCRPSCRSRLPKRENVRFYALPAAAEAQGFRACKRCHPRLVPLKDEAVVRIEALCEYINTHLDDTLTLEELGQQAHWSPFYLQRVFKHYMGISPHQYLEAKRMAHFKQELKAGTSVTQASLEAGFRSPSRLYAQTEAHMGMTPSIYQQGGAQMQIRYASTDTPLGKILIAMTERGICALEMGEAETHLIARLREEFPKAELYADAEALRSALDAVLAYLQGWQPHLDLPVDIRVTAFQQRVLDELQRIPYGETRTYAQIAQAIGNPKAARAVGNACNRNPVPLVIPCHRVVGSDGSLTGYAFGLERKQHLLDMEQTHALETS